MVAGCLHGRLYGTQVRASVDDHRKKNTETINVRATMEKPRFDMSVFRSVGTRSTANTFRFKSSRLTVLLQTLFARFRNPQQLVTMFSARILLAHFARINLLGAKCSIAPLISTANPRRGGKFPSLPLYKNEYVRLVLEDYWEQVKAR